MNVEIISIGDELLIGQTVNTNSSWMGEQLSLIGCKVSQITTISDNELQIINSLKLASKNADVILITGGLGPTKDDITKHTLCKYFNTKLAMNESVLDKIKDFFNSRDLEMLDVNRDQAMLPIECDVLENKKGTACGMWFTKDDVIYVSMPGVPYEMKGIMIDAVLPRLKDVIGSDKVVHRTIKTVGIGESFLAEKIKNWELDLVQTGVSLAYLPSPGIVKLRLSVAGKHENELNGILIQKIEELTDLVGDYIFGYEKDTLESVIGTLLKEKKMMIASAESCTGGNIAKLVTSVPGSSEYFKGSVIAYSNEVKEKILNVSSQDLEKYGAVSQSVVEQMATGVLSLLNVDFAVATSGIAGPDGGTDEKPVGTIWIAVATKEGVKSKKLQLGKSRNRNIQITSLYTLDLLRKEINK